MDRKIKLIWDFYGADAEKTAEHHKIHLTEFDVKENINSLNFSIEKIKDSHFIAAMVVKENIVFKVRDAVKPHRAEIVD